MKQSFSSKTPRLWVALATMALAACTERPNPTRPELPQPNRAIICRPDCGGEGGGGGGGGGSPPPPPPSVSITSLSLANTTLPIDGVSGTYTATLTNGGASLSGVGAQGYIVQGTTRRAAGGTLVSCGAATGVLPSGSCQISFSVAATNSTGGVGTLIPGAATFELDLSVSTFTFTRTAGVSLVPGDFNIHVSPFTMISLSGALSEFGVSVRNDGSQPISSLSYETRVIQGSAYRSAGTTPLACELAAPGILPGFAMCTISIWPSVTNNTSGTGTLVAGAATFQVSLVQGGRVLSTKSYPITLVDGRFTSVTPSSSPASIGGGTQPFTATVSNAGGSLSNVSLSGSIRQGATVQGSVTASINCAGGTGVLPSGTCAISGTYSTNTIQPGPVLVPGPATLYLSLRGTNGSGKFLISYQIDSAGVPITLIAP